MGFKDANRPDAPCGRTKEATAGRSAGTAFCRQASVRKTRQKCSRLSSSCAAPVTGRP
ncbi:MAG: protein DedD [Mesorhizobium sp.]|nr:MAG: protein DedD [Mesorhizobium sp.]